MRRVGGLPELASGPRADQQQYPDADDYGYECNLTRLTTLPPPCEFQPCGIRHFAQADWKRSGLGEKLTSTATVRCLLFPQ